MLLRILGANRMEDFLVAGNEIVSSYHYSFFFYFLFSQLFVRECSHKTTQYWKLKPFLYE